MRNKRFFIVLVGALIFGVLAAVSVSRYLSSAQAYSKNMSKVAVAKVAIPIGSKSSTIIAVGLSIMGKKGSWNRGKVEARSCSSQLHKARHPAMAIQSLSPPGSSGIAAAG